MSGEVKVLDRAGVEGLRCWVERGEAVIELSLNHAAVLEAGLGRLLFRQGRGWQADFKHLSMGFKKAADVGHLRVRLPLQGMAGIVRNFSGIICAPAIKINRPRRMDIWLMLLTGGGAPSIALSKPILMAERVSVQASLSAENGVLRYNMNTQGQGFRKAGLELVREISIGLSATHGLEGVTAKEKLAEARPGETVQSEWRPVTNSANPLLVATGSFPGLFPSKSDVVNVLRELGAPISNTYTFLLGPRFEKTPFVVGDGEPINYRLRLAVNGKRVDEAEMKVAFSQPTHSI